MPTAPSIYLDHAATTPLRPEVRAALEPFLSNELFGNPSSSHRTGQAARAALENARRQLATALDVEPRAVVFTSGGTEADNLAVLGSALAARSARRAFRVAVSAIEHKAVLDAAHAVERLGGEAVVLPVDTSGRVAPSTVAAVLAHEVAVLSVLWVSNEIGVVQDIPAMAAAAREAGVPFHTDAVQALGKVPCTIGGDGPAMVSVSGHKIGAPKGVGALVLRDAELVEPLLHGGGQQRGIRPGTENLMGAVALATAVELAVREQQVFADTVRPLRDGLERALRSAIPDASVNGAGAPRAPHIANVAFPGADAASLLVQLDLAGVACSTGSACASGGAEPSHVLAAIGASDAAARGSLRFSFSRGNSDADVARVVALLPDMVARARRTT